MRQSTSKIVVSSVLLLGWSTAIAQQPRVPPASTTSITPASTSSHQCPTPACLEPSNGPVGPEAKPPEARDLTLQYPGESALSAEDLGSLGGVIDNAAKVAAPALEQFGGAVVTIAGEAAGSAASGVKVAIEGYSAAEKGYESNGVPGAIEGVAKVGTKELVNSGAFWLGTSLAAPLGPLAPACGVLLSCAAESATDYVLNQPLPGPSDTGFVCAKVGECNPDPASLDAAIDDAVDSSVQNVNGKFDAAVTEASKAQSALAAADSTATTARQSSEPGALDSLISGIQAFQAIQSVGQHSSLPNASSRQKPLPFVACYVARGPESNVGLPNCNACCTSDGRQTYIGPPWSGATTNPMSSETAAPRVSPPPCVPSVYTDCKTWTK
jgi:hypothetical protein